MDPRMVARKLDLLRELAVVERRHLGPWRGRAALHLRPDEYEVLEEWHPVADGSRWPALQTVFPETAAAVPEGWDPARAFLVFGFEAMEGLLSVDGHPRGGLDFGHSRVPAPGPGRHDLKIEPLSVPRAFSQPGERGSRGVFHGGPLVLTGAHERPVHRNTSCCGCTSRTALGAGPVSSISFRAKA